MKQETVTPAPTRQLVRSHSSSRLIKRKKSVMNTNDSNNFNPAKKANLTVRYTGSASTTPIMFFYSSSNVDDEKSRNNSSEWIEKYENGARCGLFRDEIQRDATISQVRELKHIKLEIMKMKIMMKLGGGEEGERMRSDV
ncbi:hypothetical protein ACHAXS_001418 [Conticribra weissflogii]